VTNPYRDGPNPQIFKLQYKEKIKSLLGLLKFNMLQATLFIIILSVLAFFGYVYYQDISTHDGCHISYNEEGNYWGYYEDVLWQREDNLIRGGQHWEVLVFQKHYNCETKNLNEAYYEDYEKELDKAHRRGYETTRHTSFRCDTIYDKESDQWHYREVYYHDGKVIIVFSGTMEEIIDFNKQYDCYTHSFK